MIRKEFYQSGLRLRRRQQRERQHQLASHKLTDVVALCCYFDRVARRLTHGESHFALRPAAKRDAQAETLTLCCYGVEVRLVDAAGLWLCQRLHDTLPPEFVVPSESSEVSVSYLVTTIIPSGLTEASEYLITCDDVAVFATSVEEELYWWLRRDIEQVVTRRSPQMLFVHAGVVGWGGVGIVIPGRASIGKSTLVAELVRCGAVYYSDTFAVLDEEGKVHPYRGLIGLDVEGHPQNLRLVREDGPMGPLRIGLIVDGTYSPEGVWRPTVVRGSHAALSLVDSTVLAREQAARMQQIIAQVAASAVALRGLRSEAKEVAALLLDAVDDALVVCAIDIADDKHGHLVDELARVAESRLRSSDERAPSLRSRLLAARYVRVADFLDPADHKRLLQYALSGESSEHLNEIWEMFDRRLHAMLPFVREQLDMVWFPVGRVEWQFTPSDRGKISVPGADTDKCQTSGRRISCIYSFHQVPKRFSGGELKLYDSWLTPNTSTPAETSTTLESINNSLVFFPSDTFHEVCPLYSQTDTFADISFSITIRFWEVEPPAQDSNVAGRTVDADTRSPLPSPVERRRPVGGPHSKSLVAVVVPVPRFPLSADEQIAIRHLRTHLGGFDRYMIGPHSAPDAFSDFARPSAPACDFMDRVTYNRLLMSEQFYRAFEGYEYILIYQLDCLVFSNALEAWCRKGFDYIGAPWFERWHQFRSERSEYPEDIIDGFGTVGNGGFSLRKVSAALNVLTSTKRPLYDRLVQELVTTPDLDLHEDIFWSFEAPKLVDDFRIPTPRQALQFAFETEPRHCYRENGYQLPFGCHGWHAWDRSFWEPFLLK